MKLRILTPVLAVCFAAPAFAQSTTGSATMSSTAVQAKNKVSPSLAASAKVSLDSAKALARATADSGEVSSAELTLKHKRLVYEVKVLNHSKRASEVTIDAMTGEVIQNKKYGGLKSTVVHHEENKKLLDAKRDSAARTP
jgi:hypothetical protein